MKLLCVNRQEHEIGESDGQQRKLKRKPPTPPSSLTYLKHSLSTFPKLLLRMNNGNNRALVKPY